MRKGTLITGLTIILGLGAGMAAADGHTSDFVGNKGYVGDAGAKGYVGPSATYTQPHGQLVYRHRSERRGSGPLHAVPGCPRGFNGMFRGTLYCVNGKPMS